MRQRFRESSGIPFSNLDLNHKVFVAGTFQNFAKRVVKQIDDSLKVNGENINLVDLGEIGYRPVFSSLFHKFHGLQILINDTEETEIFLTNFVQHPVTKNWGADVTFVIKDHFGLDENDAITYQYSHPGFVSWWLLQHRRGFRPFETHITIHTHVYLTR